MNESRSLELVISEYQSLGEIGAAKIAVESSEGRIVGELASSHQWTEEGAHQLFALAQKYGSFILRNALALAIVLDIEDGELGL